MKIISQVDPRFKDLKFPGTNYLWSTYGCWATCICMLLDKDPFDLVKENPDGWLPDGNLKTDQVLAKYGYKVVKKTLVEGQFLPQGDVPMVFRTSFYSPKFPTHFFVQLPSSTQIVDPASMYNPKTDNKYKDRVNEMRTIELITSPINNIEEAKKHLKIAMDLLG